MTGLRFECQQGCTKCCEQRGFVYLTEADLSRISKHVGLSAAEFERRFVYRTKHLLRLRMPRRAWVRTSGYARCRSTPWHTCRAIRRLEALRRDIWSARSTRSAV